MAFAPIAHISAGGDGTGFGVATPAIDTTGANLFITHLGWYNNAPIVMTDSKANVWNYLVVQQTTDSTSVIAWCIPTTVGTGHTFQATNGGIYPTLCVEVFGGAAASGPVDVQNGAAGSANNTFSPGSVTPTQAGDLIVAGICLDAAATLAIGSGFTISDQVAFNSGTNLNGALAYLIQGAAAPVNPAWSWATGTINAAGTIAAFKAAAGGSPTATITEQNLPANHNGNITVHAVGTGTSWSSSTTWTPSGVAGWSVASKTQVDGTHYTIVLTPPAAATPPTGATGTLTLTEGVTGTVAATTTVGTPTLAISPTSGNTGTAPTLTMNGANTIWGSETAAGLFTVSGGTGASIATPTSITNTSASDVLTVGSSAGTLTIRDASTGATATFTAIVPPQTIPVTNANLFFSPYNWFSDGGGSLAANNINASSTYGRTSNPGAYLKFSVTTPASGTVKLNLDNTFLQTLTAANCPRIAVSIDGGAFTSTLLVYSGSAVQLTIASGLTAATHTIIIYFQGTVLSGSSAMGDRWNNSATGSSVVKVTGIEIQGAASMASQTLRSKTMIVYGDSITEGADAVGSANGPGDQDSTQTFAMLLARALDAEVGIIGWAGAGYIAAGYGNVPGLYNPTDSLQHWNKFSAGNSRLVAGLFSPAPDFVGILHGRNDGGSSDATVTAVVTALLPNVRTAAPSARIFVIPTFDRTKASAVLAGTLPSSPANFVDVGTIPEALLMFSNDGVHPNVRGHAVYGSMLAKVIQADIGGSASRVGSPIVAVGPYYMM